MHYQSPRLDTNTNDHWHLDTFDPFSYQYMYYDSDFVLIKSRKVRGEDRRWRFSEGHILEWSSVQSDLVISNSLAMGWKFSNVSDDIQEFKTLRQKSITKQGWFNQFNMLCIYSIILEKQLSKFSRLISISYIKH